MSAKFCALKWTLPGIALVAVASACAQPTEQRGSAPSRLGQLQTECRAKGGSVSASGLRAQPHCVVPTKDANRPCSDSAECQAGCIAVQPTPPAGTPLGRCKPNDEPFGCFAEVLNGRVQPMLCVD